MSLAQSREPLRLPASLQAQLHEFRRRVWTIKMAEAFGAAVFVVLATFLCVFAADRLGDTPRWLRSSIWTAAACGCAIVPLQLQTLDLACCCCLEQSRLLTAKLPRLGDQLLGIIELVESEGEQKRSRALCEAAVRSVALDAQKCNLNIAAPNSRHRSWWAMAMFFGAATVGLGVAFPTASSNAWARFLAPWSDTPRYTFTELELLPSQIVVAHGEPFQINVNLTAGSPWAPAAGPSANRARKPRCFRRWLTAATASNCPARLPKKRCN